MAMCPYCGEDIKDENEFISHLNRHLSNGDIPKRKFNEYYKIWQDAHQAELGVLNQREEFPDETPPEPTRWEKTKGWAKGMGEKGKEAQHADWPRRAITILLVWLGFVVAGVVISGFGLANIGWFTFGGFMIAFSIGWPRKPDYFGYLKGVTRFTGVLLLGWAFWGIYPALGLIIFFLGYMTMPTRLTQEGYNIALAWCRVVLGVSMSLMIFEMLGAATLVRLSLFFIFLGFFAAFPEVSPGEPSRGGEEGGKGLHIKIINKTDQISGYSGFISFVLCGFGTLFGIVAIWSLPGIGLASFETFMFFIFGGVASFTALSTPPSVRGAAGLPFVFMIFIVTGSLFPYVGTAFFGQWWPTIQTGLEDTFGPMVTSMRQVTGTFGQGWQCIASPATCYQIFQPPSKTEQGVEALELTSVSSIERSITRLPTEENPVKMKVIIEIENKGKEVARNIDIGLKKPTISRRYTEGEGAGVTTREVPVGEIDGINCEGEKTSFFEPCEIDKIVPGGLRQLVGYYDITGIETWGSKQMRGEYINYGAVMNYTYGANATLDVEVMNASYYEKLSAEDNLEFRTVTSKYSGGPVGVGISVMKKQPIRDDLGEVPVFIGLNNFGKGTIPEGGIKNAYINVSDIADEKGICTLEKDLKSLEDNLPLPSGGVKKTGKGIISGKLEQVVVKSNCMITLKDIDVDKKTFGINGYVKYIYQQEKTNKIPIDFQATGGCPNPGTCVFEGGKYTGEYCNERGIIEDCKDKCCVKKCEKGNISYCVENECTDCIIPPQE